MMLLLLLLPEDGWMNARALRHEEAKRSKARQTTTMNIIRVNVYSTVEAAA